MAWSVIRRATDEDWARLIAFENRFTLRHQTELTAARLTVDDLGPRTPILAYGASVETERGWRHLNPLYRAGVRRALRHHWAEGIGYGAVGFHVA